MYEFSAIWFDVNKQSWLHTETVDRDNNKNFVFLESAKFLEENQKWSSRLSRAPLEMPWLIYLGIFGN